MSIYSGFAKRKQETVYNQLIFKALELLAEYTLQHLRIDVLDEKNASWCKKIIKINKAMAYMERSKHLEPNMSTAISTLAARMVDNVKDQI